MVEIIDTPDCEGYTFEQMTTQMLSSTDPGAIDRAATQLRAGDLVAFPTDTVYGVGAVFSNAPAVEKLYTAKGRPESKGIPILLADTAQLHLVASTVIEGAGKLAAAYWPGPLTLVLPRRPEISTVISRVSTIAVRVPDHPLARDLIRAVGVPLAVTSANRSGQPATTDPIRVLHMLKNRIALILDGGLAPGGTPSTIVDCTMDPPVILRRGPIGEQEILSTWKSTSPAQKNTSSPR